MAAGLFLTISFVFAVLNSSSTQFYWTYDHVHGEKCYVSKGWEVGGSDYIIGNPHTFLGDSGWCKLKRVEKITWVPHIQPDNYFL